MSIMQRFRRLGARGDTLVEVLIAISVISSVLGGAYVTTNKSLTAARTAQERSIALKLTEAQVEQLKHIVGTAPDLIFGATVPGTYCLDQSSAVKVSTDAACAVNQSGAPVAKEPTYHLTITRSGNTFTVKTTWASLTAHTNTNVQMIYRVYQ